MNVSHYPVQPGLFAGEYPGNQSPNVAETRLRELVENGVRTFIDLTSELDGLTPYEPLFAEIDNDGSLALRRYAFEIPDMHIPSGPELMRAILERIQAEIEADRACYVHCWGGIGRTGTTIGCWLREGGLDPDAALARVQLLYGSHMDPGKLSRYPHSPQQPTQVHYVRNWPDV
jgi:hypothetical protein